MHAIIRQAKANLKSHRLQATLILLTLFAAATLLTVALSTWRSVQGAYDRLFERTHGAHLWLYLDPRRATVEQAQTALANLSGVQDTTGVMRYLRATLFAGEDRLSGHHLRVWPDEAVTVGRPLLVAGRIPRPGETNAIVLDRNVAVVHDVKVGDRISLLLPDGRRPLTVVGLYVSAEFCPYPSCFPTRHYLAPDTMIDDSNELLRTLGTSSSPASDVEGLAIGLRLHSPADVTAMKHAIESQLPAESVDRWTSWQETRQAADFSIQFQRILLTVFSIVATLAAGFLIANTIGGRVRAQTRQIGLLKAIGFTRQQLALLYLVESLALAMVVSLAGLVVGSLMAQNILRSVTAQFGETQIRPALWIAIVVPLSTLLITAIFTLWPVRRAARLGVVQAIRFGTERPRHRTARLPRVLLPLAVGLSDLLSRPLRSTLTSLGLGMAVLTLTAALTINATLRAFISNPGLGGFDADLFLYPSAYMSETETRRLIAAQSDVAAYYAQLWWGFQFPGEEETLHARLLEGDLRAFEFPLIEGRMFEKLDEVMVGYGLLRERNLHPGSTLNILLEGEPLTLQVVGAYRENSNMGRMLMLPAEALRRVRPDAEPFSYVLKLHPGADPQATAVTFASDSNDLLEVLVVSDVDLPGMVATLPGVMAALSLVLVGIAVVGVFNNVWTVVRERRRELALLKAVGMTPRQVTLSVLVGAGMMALIAYAVGLPVGLAGIRVLMDAMARAIGFGPLDPPLDPVGLALMLPGILLVAAAGAFLPAHRAGRTSVVDILRYE